MLHNIALVLTLTFKKSTTIRATPALCCCCRTLWLWEQVSVMAWDSGTTPRQRWFVLAWWRWSPSPRSSAQTAPSPPPPSWRAAASLTSSQPATGDATARSGKLSPKQAKYEEQIWSPSLFIYNNFCNSLLIKNQTHFSVQTIEQLENELLNGQKLQGPATATEVHQVLKQKNMVEKYVWLVIYYLFYESLSQDGLFSIFAIPDTRQLYWGYLSLKGIWLCPHYTGLCLNQTQLLSAVESSLWGWKAASKTRKVLEKPHVAAFIVYSLYSLYKQDKICKSTRFTGWFCYI